MDELLPTDVDILAHSCIPVDVIHECAIIRRGLVATLYQLAGVALGSEAIDAAEYLRVPDASRSMIAIVSPAAKASLLTRKALEASLIEVVPTLDELELRELRRDGVMGLLHLSVEPDELLQAAQCVARGQHYLMQAPARPSADGECLVTLTRREHQILEFLAEGRCNKTIAKALGIALGTVKTHMKAILFKLDVSSRTEALVVATRRGLLGSIEARADVPQAWTGLSIPSRQLASSFSRTRMT